MSDKPQASDFIALKQRYEKLSKGEQAEIRKVADLQDLVMRPAAWKLGVNLNQDFNGWLSVVMFLPLMEHQADGPSLGAQLYAGKINEMRLFQALRSKQPKDLDYLRRLVRQAEPKVDWGKTGQLLYYWHANEYSKRRLAQDYFNAKHPFKSDKSDKSADRNKEIQEV